MEKVHFHDSFELLVLLEFCIDDDLHENAILQNFVRIATKAAESQKKKSNQLNF